MFGQIPLNNPDGEALYTKVGFEYLNDNLWGGHPMKHLILPVMLKTTKSAE